MKETIENEKLVVHSIAELKKLPPPELIFIPSRGVTPDVPREHTFHLNEKVGYRSTNEETTIHDDIGLGVWGIEAAAMLHTDDYFKEAIISTNSGIERDTISNAEVARRELNNLGVPLAKIIFQSDTYNTYTELQRLVTMIVENKYRHAIVLTNDIQQDRLVAMLQHMENVYDKKNAHRDKKFVEDLKKFRQHEQKGLTRITIVNAGDILAEKDKEWKSRVFTFRMSPDITKALRKTQQAVRDIKGHVYGMTRREKRTKKKKERKYTRVLRAWGRLWKP